jgi:uncharacterized membrane protein
MRILRYLAALVAVLALVALTAWLLSKSFAEAVFLAPIIVVGGAAVVGLVILWGKVALNSLRESRHPRRVLAYWLIGIGLLVALTALGVRLPNEGG